MQPNSITLDDTLWQRLLDLTDGAAALCYQCGTCTATCPWGLVRQTPLSVRTFMRQAQLGLQPANLQTCQSFDKAQGKPSNLQADLWLCTTCAQCEALCPRGVGIADVFRALRTIAWERRTVEHGLPSLLWSVYWNNNPWSQPPSQRAEWAKKLNIPAFNPKKHEILFYVGCTSSYDRRAQKIAIALVKTLNAAKVKFGFLGDEEPCCGEAVLNLGHKPYFQEIAENAAKVFQARGVSRLVTVSPHCYDVFKNHYPTFQTSKLPTFQPLHYTQFLAQLLDEGCLKFNQPLNAKVTFQDPCYLGRHNDEYEAPRCVLTAIPGLELVEMETSRADGLCCGGGGGRMWLETAPGERFSDLRVKQAAKAGADVLATACPFCVVCLEDSTKMIKAEKLQVMDVAEIVAKILV